MDCLQLRVDQRRRSYASQSPSSAMSSKMLLAPRFSLGSSNVPKARGLTFGSDGFVLANRWEPLAAKW